MDPLDHRVNQQALELANEILQENKRNRRARWLGRAFWVVLFVSIAIFLNSKENNLVSEPHIAVVDLIGPMLSGTQASSEAVIPVMRQAFENPNSKAVFFNANSPGGSPVQASRINKALIRLKEEYNKPVYAVISDLCASACYYAIAHSDKIFADSVSLVGSIGVRLESYDLRELANKVGVKQRLYTSGKYKALINPFSNVPVEVEEHLQAVIDETHHEFISVVKSGRQNKITDDPLLFSGLIWGGSEALQLGLIDTIGDSYKAADGFKPITLINYTPKESILERFLDAFENIILLTQSSQQIQLR